MKTQYAHGQRWPGGYIHLQNDGEPLFIIERRVDRERFHISTRTHSWTAAMKQLERFEANPAAYSPAGDVTDDPLVMTAELMLAYKAFLLDVRHVTGKYARETAKRLADWEEDLRGLDLRKVTLRDHIKPALDRRRVGRQHRIIALKAFCGWLRKERHLLTSAQDPTMDMPVPQAQPEKWRRRKAVPQKVVQRAFRKLPARHQDALMVLAATGWHVTELERFVRLEESELVEQRRGKVIAVFVARHKNREFTRTPITDPGVLAAAKRLRKAGTIPRKFNQALYDACDAAKVKRFTGGVMRHSVATWAVENVTDPRDVSTFLNHKDPGTTKRFYIDLAIPTNTVKLKHLTVVQGGRSATAKKTG